jgi:TATA-box binding protein (TBP) (component of TFIID and TFIIIB)
MVKFACTIHNFDTLKKSGLLGSKYDFLKIITVSNILASVATRQLNEEIKNELINQATRELSINEDKFIGIMAEIYDVKERINTYMW